MGPNSFIEFVNTGKTDDNTGGNGSAYFTLSLGPALLASGGISYIATANNVWIIRSIIGALNSTSAQSATTTLQNSQPLAGQQSQSSGVMGGIVTGIGNHAVTLALSAVDMTQNQTLTYALNNPNASRTEWSMFSFVRLMS